MMNPPFNDALRHRPSPDAARRAAHEAEPHTLDAWTHAARRILRPGGALTLIWRAEGLREVLAAIDKGFGGVGVVNVHPRPDAPAIRVLVRAVKGSRAPLALHPPLMLETRAGVLSDEAAAILTARDILPLARD
jgi:tRNA1(Val) A37 N6-methylase TrmN6